MKNTYEKQDLQYTIMCLIVLFKSTYNIPFYIKAPKRFWTAVTPHPAERLNVQAPVGGALRRIAAHFPPEALRLAGCPGIPDRFRAMA